MTPQQLNKCLQKFYLSARGRNGTFYNKKSLTAVRVHRTAREIFAVYCQKESYSWSAIYSTCVVYTKTIIHLRVGE